MKIKIRMESKHYIERIDQIADILANMHDSLDEDIRSEFLTIAHRSSMGMPIGTLEQIFDQFLALDSQVRFDRKFDHRAFVRKFISN